MGPSLICGQRFAAIGILFYNPHHKTVNLTRLNAIWTPSK